MHTRIMAGATRRIPNAPRFLGCGLLVLFAVVSEPVAAQTGDDLIASFLTVDGATRMLGFTAGMQTSSTFERDRRGFGIEAKQVMSKWVGMFLMGQVLDSPIKDGGAEVEVDMGIDLFLVRAGPVALSLQTFAGVHNLTPDEGESVLLQYGAGGGAYVAMGRHVVLGLTGTRNQVDTMEGSRNSFLLHLLIR